MGMPCASREGACRGPPGCPQIRCRPGRVSSVPDRQPCSNKAIWRTGKGGGDDEHPDIRVSGVSLRGAGGVAGRGAGCGSVVRGSAGGGGGVRAADPCRAGRPSGRGAELEVRRPVHPSRSRPARVHPGHHPPVGGDADGARVPDRVVPRGARGVGGRVLDARKVDVLLGEVMHADPPDGTPRCGSGWPRHGG